MPERLRPKMAFGEIVSFAYDTFCSNKVRFILTALGMVIGTASLILVVTIGMTGQQYVLNQIQAIGTNEIWAEYRGRAAHQQFQPRPADHRRSCTPCRNRFPASSRPRPWSSSSERVPIGNGKEKDVTILGVYPEYLRVRNLVVSLRTLLRPGGFAGSQQSRSDHRKDGAGSLRLTAGGRWKSHQAHRTALHHHRNLQGARGNLRPDRRSSTTPC